MTKEKWIEINGMIKDKFEVLDEGGEVLADEGGVTIEYIIFKGPLGKMRLEYVEKPVVIGKKTIYSRRAGSDTAVDFVYDNSEKTQKLSAYKWDDEQDDWVEMEAGFQF